MEKITVTVTHEKALRPLNNKRTFKSWEDFLKDERYPKFLKDTIRTIHSGLYGPFTFSISENTGNYTFKKITVTIS